MRTTGRLAIIFGIVGFSGLLSVTTGQAARPTSRAGGTPTLDNAMWNKLSALRSYHAESTLKWTGSAAKPGTVHWTEDVHGKDYHLTLISSSGSTQRSDMYFVGGHFYIGEGGHFMDLGNVGKQMAAAMLPMTMGYWTALTQDGHNVHYVGRVTTSGRTAYRFTVQYAVSAPGVGGNPLTVARALFTNTVDIDVATHAPLRVTGLFRGQGEGQSFSLSTSFLVSHVGQVGAIKVP